MKMLVIDTGTELIYLCTVLVQFRHSFIVRPVTQGDRTLWQLTVPQEALPDLERFRTSATDEGKR